MDELKLIDEFRRGNTYSYENLKHFVLGYTNNKVSDTVMTKFLKSIFDKGLSIEETAQLTEIMMNSGDTIDLKDIPGIKVDKHSTGGVGDKVTLIVAPIVASFGVTVAKMSGRGLGFTGGTLDKLESIPGYNIFLSDDQFKECLIKNQISVIGQTKNLVPADKKIYALRDEKNLVASMPLIASSIMSKKLATGADAILLDVKCGNAAFMKTQKEAETLAKWMIDLGAHMKRNVRAEITSMETPLGRMIGNKNEVMEAVAMLENKNIAHDLKEVVYSSSSTMLVQAGLYENESEAKVAIENKIKSGEALSKFKSWIISQSGDVDAVFKDDFWNPKYKKEIKAVKSGFMNINDAVSFGIIAMKIGAGRVEKEDGIDYEAGIEIHKKTGEEVKEDEVIFTLYSSNPINDKFAEEIKAAYIISDKPKIKKTILNKL